MAEAHARPQQISGCQQFSFQFSPPLLFPRLNVLLPLRTLATRMATGKEQKSKDISDTFEEHRARLIAGKGDYKSVLPKDYARPGLDKHHLGELIDVIATISLPGAPSSARQEGAPKPSDARRSAHRSTDILGRVDEYFLTRFASAEGKLGDISIYGQESNATTRRRALIEADLVDCMVALPA